MKPYTYYIGIDAGTHTGVAIWSKKKKEFLLLTTLKIHQAMELVNNTMAKGSVFVRVEDARQRRWYGERSNLKQQGAGSVKRDCTIWQDFLTDIGADFEMVPPRKGMTKYSAETFKKVTGYNGLSSEHSRDAGVLVFQM